MKFVNLSSGIHHDRTIRDRYSSKTNDMHDKIVPKSLGGTVVVIFSVTDERHTTLATARDHQWRTKSTEKALLSLDSAHICLHMSVSISRCGGRISRLEERVGQ